MCFIKFNLNRLFSFIHGVNGTGDNGDRYLKLNPFPIEILITLFLLILAQALILRPKAPLQGVWEQFSAVVSYHLPSGRRTCHGAIWLLASFMLFELYFAGFRSGVMTMKTSNPAQNTMNISEIKTLLLSSKRVLVISSRNHLTWKDRERFFGTSNWTALEGRRIITEYRYSKIGHMICTDPNYIYYGFLMAFQSLSKNRPKNCDYKL